MKRSIRYIPTNRGQVFNAYTITQALYTKNLGASNRSSILEMLKCGPHTTLDFMEVGIIHPGPRISELRQKGFPIDSDLDTEKDSYGIPHQNIATYSLRNSEFFRGVR